MGEAEDLKNRISDAMKAAMRAQDTERLATIRLIRASIQRKEKEADTQAPLTAQDIVALLDKMVRQGRESIRQFEEGNRSDLVKKETFQIEVIQSFMPEALTPEALKALIQQAIDEVGAQSVRDMQAVMALLAPKVQGRADIKEVGKVVKDLLLQ